MKKLFVALLLLSFFLTSCKKKEDAIPQPDSECFQQTALNSAEIAQKLLGKWNWQYSFSGGDRIPEFSDDVNKGLSLEFKSDGNLILSRSGEAAVTSSWSLQPAVNGYFNLVATPIINEAFGFVLFCDNQLLFNGAAGDGTNNYFKRD